MFTGRWFDIETGLYYYRARYYNPHIGRFMQTDPIGYEDSINWYSYCGNNPLGFVDPYGLAQVSVRCYADLESAIRQLGFNPVYHNLYVIIGDGLPYLPDPKNPDQLYTYYLATGSVNGVSVVLLNGVGLLDHNTLNSIIYDNIVKINDWGFGLTSENLYNLRWSGDCDGAFTKTSIQQWLYQGHGQIDSGSDINYILQGHAMHYIRLSKRWGRLYVRTWKFINYFRISVTEPVWFWWEKGYDEYFERQWFTPLEDWLDDLLSE